MTFDTHFREGGKKALMERHPEIPNLERMFNSLMRGQVYTLRDALRLSDDTLLGFVNFGVGSLTSLRQLLYAEMREVIDPDAPREMTRAERDAAELQRLRDEWEEEERAERRQREILQDFRAAYLESLPHVKMHHPALGVTKSFPEKVASIWEASGWELVAS